MLRCPSPVAVLGTLLTLGFGLLPMTARAAAVNPNATTATATYRLTSTISLPVPDPKDTNTQEPQVVGLVVPPGSVVPPQLPNGKQGSPLTILPDSHGFDPNNLIVALKDGTSASGQPEQMFGLVFFGQGLQPGGVLHFSLSIDKALASNPPVLQSLTSGITITADSTAATPSPADPIHSGGQEIPEPLSVVLWSSLLVGVVARHRLTRRPKTPVSIA